MSLTYESTAQPKTTTDGLHYHVAGEGPALIMLHGSGPGVSGWSNFSENLPVFAQHFRTYVFDLPNFGASTDLELTRPYPEHAAEALIRAMDDLGIDQAHLVGNSMGGWVSLTAALAAPERFGSLALMGPGGLFAEVFSPPKSEGARRLFDYVSAPSREAMIRWVDCMVHDPALITDELIEERIAMAQAPGAIERMRAVLGSLGNATDELPLLLRLPELVNPTLVIWGRDDRMLPLEGAFFGTRRIPKADLLVLSDCGHWAQVERKADFESAVLDFLSR
ncbi:alpha/beta fold hydrolase [Nocardioides sp. W7]|uniref:alpha/beta fold hydrolase n=1 Tax=Nocardioides sp. W7 TaxID=2931390 RepID=UPI001FCF97FB|nr:alpha/beta fold hydrolase [Nocardioides sp. W7]